jgi:hypothetical protein
MKELKTFKRLLSNGPLTAMPKRPEDQVLIARLAGTRFRADHAYREADVNETLKEWLATFSAPYGIDHVTLRRFMVDMQVLKRDRSGSTYHLNPACVEGIDASLDPARVLAQASAEREERRKRHVH